MAISSDAQLAAYNEALRILGERRLASLSEAREPRRVLDDAWVGAVRYCLGKSDWTFATRTIQIGWSPDVTPAFGYTYAFEIPTDMVRLTTLASDEYLHHPLTNDQYRTEAGYWLSDYTELFCQFVSDASGYGENSGLWIEPFTKYLGAYLASETCERITNSTAKRDRAERGMENALADARSHNSMGQGVKFPPPSSWVLSRGTRMGRGDRR